eukprot:CAMPEP_0168564854 /NCGR_PEP_ID=MMETSP0413-20121227/13483_1 /TAXON_ID=136452 /ORGANISM="Filamoeba nolandi, Strain NC-AS-23-1" /LENGTH=404 /DNA_ID=CAMNT_0008596585 /DNA_START=39 /DNA_END=1253 /DNA_ORIENTATION=+
MAQNTQYDERTVVTPQIPESTNATHSNSNGTSQNDNYAAYYAYTQQPPTNSQTQSQTTEESSPPTKQSASSEGVNLFISSLPPEVDDASLIKLFSPFGKIVSAKVMVDLNTKVSRGFGFVKYSTLDEAKLAIQQMNGEALGGKNLVVQYAESKGTTTPSSTTQLGTPSNNLYIKGIPLNMTEDQLYSLFSPYGTITSHKILRDLQSGMSRGLGFVAFEQQQAAQYAISALNGYIFPGTFKGIVVRYADTEEEKFARKTKHQKRSSSARYNPYGGAPNMAQAAYAYAPYGYAPQPGYGPAPYYPYPQAAAPMPASTAPATSTGNQQQTTLFIYHLPSNADDSLLYKLFSPYGAITNVRVVKDEASGQCKGYGFVTMSNWMSAANAIQGLNGYKIENKYLSVSYKK